MKLIIRYISLNLLLIFNTNLLAQIPQKLFPENHFDLENPIEYEKLSMFAEQAKEISFIDVFVEGKTVEDQSLYLFHIYRGLKPSKWKVFFFAQQHGNEPAGKDALIYLIHQIIIKPEILPEDVELWLMPMVNPDGAEKNQRRNGNDFDLNRDHQLLSQPETQTLHRVFRRIIPHISVDCHEFMRDSKDYDDRGLLEWPLIMMDCGNNPLLDSEIYEAGIRWCNNAIPYMLQKGYNYSRYYLGGFPPLEELRHSTPEVDDARNGFGLYGGLSFIIESGIKRKSENPNADLGKRIDAYLILLKQFLHKNKYRESDIKNIQRSRESELPDFLPTNYFWANVGQKINNIRVIEKSTGKVKKIPTANFMKDLVIKNSVPSPQGYAIPKEHVEIFKTLLDRHAISYKVMTENKNFKVERCRLIKYEDFRDKLYSRYAGRQIVQSDTVLEKEFEIGSIYIDLNNINGKRAALLLEPLQLYGLYQYQDFRNIIDEDKVLPVWRVLGNNR